MVNAALGDSIRWTVTEKRVPDGKVTVAGVEAFADAEVADVTEVTDPGVDALDAEAAVAARSKRSARYS